MDEPIFFRAKDLPRGILKFSEILCGCGRPIDCWKWLHEYLRFAGNDSHYYGSNCTPQELLCIYLCAYIGLTEHGTAIFGAWLSEDGEECLKWLDNNIDKMDEFVIDHSD